ncbi:NADH-quinone oxidoreductase subunit NuoN [Candidatus Berkiella cookevillensis]|uniref:NADH-quinone oxidoreductase subunit N n=1 Tax=Candidatus Berkiella cookevillensis TaxID=437022 RepID=A0A0Q9YDH8_9GAMM|nr:NADH-quinone oxidoreductase subunit NuoN [Candidatus Berkiella cookevillensis]MCS5707849.1 NADH-quinone oxidoreductase subunit NuoN [Candidatus Berkiella cookevillensis]
MQADFSLIMPEITLLVAACIVLLVDVFIKPNWRGLTYFLSQLALVVSFVVCLQTEVQAPSVSFSNHWVVDPLSQMLKLFMLGVMFIVFLYSRVYVTERTIARGEFHILALFSTLGMMLLVSANTLLLLYLGLELLTLPLYVLVALRRDAADSVEAGMKYFVVGALASGLLLYGISILFGLTNSIELSQITSYIQQANADQMGLLLFALVFIVIGLAFKLGAVPCHMWIPDIYEGAPTNVTLLVGSAPKLAAFGMAYRLLNDTLMGLSQDWSQYFIVLALLSLAVGNFTAIAQTNIKRMLAYSTIAHIGFILLGFVVAPSIGFAPALFYTIVYAITACCAFGVIILLSAKGVERDTLEDIKGLCHRSPWLAFIMLLAMFSLAGVPPLVGFYAKFVILKALIDSGMVWLAAVCVVFSIIGAFYYLRVIWLMYFEKPEIVNRVGGALDLRAVLSLNGLLVLALGLLPAPLFSLCQQVFSKLVA